MHPVVLNHELLGEVPDRGEEVSFYDMNTPIELQDPVNMKRVPFHTDAGFIYYYECTGCRKAAIKVIKDIGEINEGIDCSDDEPKKGRFSWLFDLILDAW